MNDAPRQRARDVRFLILDVDGVLTDGSLYLGDDGQQYKAFNSRDGHGIRMLADSGVQIGILTGRRSQVVEHRCRDLGIQHIVQGRRDKLDALGGLLEAAGVGIEHTAYMGDDVVDLPVMRRAVLAIAVADAHPLVREHAHYITRAGGGRGAAREACEFILEAQNNLQAALAPYLE
ncbi:MULTISPECIES: 3-deoxy-manno-octulosonate-8-phosphatase KdsC [Ectothiorhodospira]|uniref:3-deoxy-D-manno-octulosonate 8-phosphate phosphatase KdsC n=1 Tax=Ectothiorhodospira marina TaxID=1396821 RepID=A0A1H7H7C4_9GAMM|nr:MULTISPECIES: 3-deoxy-manno-octulosonate-8-phosphatase KdsC [Ectothiorhodospira]MCG5515112.1 3-deoxy-manno-octulosonate-8-phosphatase KdsC [Ectothiorhodospira sp. 9100]MCG5517829.1 3-deoxy-manno-octulosonate-8-phosphatase KdsC [Ectothiorhodospira sp. 9905]SEK45667.1 3-deoxy-D-manno-octulosonate 8-phosphate phosphatase (KDO 8-P phosphatase) [Ectothiorhodospira marina]